MNNESIKLKLIQNKNKRQYLETCLFGGYNQEYGDEIRDKIALADAEQTELLRAQMELNALNLLTIFNSPAVQSDLSKLPPKKRFQYMCKLSQT